MSGYGAKNGSKITWPPMRRLAVAGGALVIILLLLRIYACAPYCGPPGGEIWSPDSSGEYNILVHNWNQFAESLAIHYRIWGDDAVSSEAVVGALDRWTRVYWERESPEFEKDLAALSEEIPGSSFHEYSAFRRSQRQAPLTRLAPTMSQAALAQALNQLAKVESLGQAPDYITRKTVKNIVYMNDFCAFFAEEKSELHKRGVDVGISQCSKAGTGGKYPALDALIRPDSPFRNQ